MKTGEFLARITVPVGIVLAFTGFIVVGPALAQEASSSPVMIDSSSTPECASDEILSDLESSTSTDGTADYSSTTPEVIVESAEAAAQTPQPTSEQPLAGLIKVNIIGTRYIDYFTDGINTYTFPGDPQIHAYIAEKDAPIPKHEGLTWVHSTGQYLYDTPSGDLEVGQYALQPSGTYIEKRPPFVSATSSPLSGGSSTAAPDTEVATSTDEASSTLSSTQ